MESGELNNASEILPLMVWVTALQELKLQDLLESYSRSYVIFLPTNFYVKVDTE
jgi:hypothetical protein